MEVVFFEAQAEFHYWLEKNHDKMSELQVGFYKKKTNKKSITYNEALDEALCFGWIDGVRKTIDDDSYTIRFTPRKRGSRWSEVNTKRVNELIELNLMQPSGLEAFNARDVNKTQQYSYEARSRALDDKYQKQFEQNEKAWDFFKSQPDYYRRAATWWVMSAKKEETQLKRLAMLIADSEGEKRIAAVTYTRKQ